MEPPAKPICALIVDDEEPARERLVARLKKDRDVGRIFEAENGVEAIRLIQEAKPDIVFLDVQMPGVDGFGVIEAIGVDDMPLTVFVTAYDHFALKAFAAEAVDYLLKPFGSTRYNATIERVKRRLRDQELKKDKAGSFGPELVKLIEKRTKPGAIWDWLVLKSGNDSRLIMTEDIDWVRATGVYVTVHAGGEKYLYRSALTTVFSRLDPFRFVRIHRSSVVNLKSIVHLERLSHGDFRVHLKDGTRLVMSRTYRAEVEARLGQDL